MTPAQIITDYEGGINAFLDTSKRIKGISTGYLKFDEMTGGLREGELIILAARPAMGKTARPNRRRPVRRTRERVDRQNRAVGRRHGEDSIRAVERKKGRCHAVSGRCCCADRSRRTVPD